MVDKKVERFNELLLRKLTMKKTCACKVKASAKSLTKELHGLDQARLILLEDALKNQNSRIASCEEKIAHLVRIASNTKESFEITFPPVAWGRSTYYWNRYSKTFDKKTLWGKIKDMFKCIK